MRYVRWPSAEVGRARRVSRGEKREKQVKYWKDEPLAPPPSWYSCGQAWDEEERPIPVIGQGEQYESTIHRFRSSRSACRGKVRSWRPVVGTARSALYRGKPPPVGYCDPPTRSRSVRSLANEASVNSPLVLARPFHGLRRELERSSTLIAPPETLPARLLNFRWARTADSSKCGCVR